MRALVTDGHFRKTLAVVRSLGRRGVDVTVGERTFLNTSFFSRYCSKRIVYPSPRLRPDQFIDFLLKELKRTRYECLFPMEEETLLLVARYRSEISKHTYLLIPELEKLEFVRDKAKLIRFAEARGIPVPKTFGSPSELSLGPLAKGDGYVIKPRISSGSFGIAYVEREEDLLPSYQRVHQRYPSPLIQEYIPDGGGTFGFSALFDEASDVKAAFVHKKLRMYPVRGGPSTLREGVEHPEIMELGLSLLRALKWVGVAMAEFKVDPRDGLPKLMEVNPRFWGSLQLAIFSEVDFPYLMLRLALGERFDPVLRYPVGRRGRWLLFGDLLHFFNNPDRFRLDPPFFRLFDRNTCDDILSREDPLPILGAALTFFTFLYDPEMKRFLERR
ncbi:MAG: ATP-grasp domain-containing protein [Desulfobacterota bacterium]|nr:ATP-grasp domain-containing protein [Thermodesulfobacteriota bacterium]